MHAWFDPLANLKTSSSCVRLADLSGDGENKLVVACRDRRMLVFRGAALTHEVVLLDVPVAMVVTYTDSSLPRLPSIAVAAGAHVFIYRQLRPYRKWTCPPVEVSKAERDIWGDMCSGAYAALTLPSH